MNKLLFIRCLTVCMFLGACFLTSISHAQTSDTASDLHTKRCGAEAPYIARGGSETALIPLTSSFSSAAIFHCGKIDVYYEDVNRNFKKGFDDTTIIGVDTLGSIRRNTFCAVLSYIQSVIDFSNVSDTAPIRIYVDTSIAPISYPAYRLGAVQFLARAYAQYDSTRPGIKNGWMNDYITRASWHLHDSLPATAFHGVLQMNFDKVYSIGPYGVTDSSVLDWQSNSSSPFTPATSCNKFDLYSVLLHETTHLLGWQSLIKFTGTGSTTLFTPVPLITTTSNVFSGIDWAFHVAANSYPLALTKVLSGTVDTPILDTSNVLFRSDNNYWITDSAAPNNYPVYSGGYPFGNVYSFLSHLDDQSLNYTIRERISPGDQQDYVMGPFSLGGVLRRKYSKGEIHTLKDALGYPLKTTFLTTNPYVYTNHLPYSRKMARLNISPANYTIATETVTPDDTLTNNVGISRTVASIAAMIASGDVTDTDAVDVSNIYIDSTTIVNFRGCGNGGNNHALLSISSDSKTITYTPRAGFYGKAQFGFNLHDGKERGSFVVMTIEVYKGTNVTCPTGANMICNPGFEEGSEVKLDSIAEDIPNSVLTENRLHEGKWQGVQFSDSHPYVFASDRDGYQLGISSGVIVGKSHYGEMAVTGSLFTNCGHEDTSTSEIGNYWLHFPTPYFYGGTMGYPFDNPYPSGSVGQRYQQFSTPGMSYYYLMDSTRHCKKYTLEFDIYKQAMNRDSVLGFKIGFTNRTVNLNTAIVDTSLNFMFYDTISVPYNVWTRITMPFNYCGTSPSNILFMAIDTPRFFGNFHIDNLSLKEDTTPNAALAVTVSPTSIGGCRVKLTANVTNAFCSPSYLWNATANTVLTAATDTVYANIHFTYSVSVSDGCRDTFATYTMMETSPPPISGSSSVCVGGNITLTNTSGGGTWSSSNSSIATVGSATGIVIGVTAGVVHITYTTTCSSVKTITVNPNPAAISGTAQACVGATTTLSDATSGGVWSSSNTSIAIVGSSTGIVTGISAGFATITYTIPTGCFVIVVATIDPIPIITPIGSLVICQSSTTSLSGWPSGGSWSSGSPSVAIVGSTGVVTGVAGGVATISYTSAAGCVAGIDVTVNPLPAITSGPSGICMGTTATYTNTTPGGVWSSTNITIATIGSSTGIATPVSTGITGIKYTLPTGCFRIKNVTVNPNPGAISGSSTVCVGSVTSYTNPTSGGMWSSSNTVIANVGSSTGIVVGISAGVATISYTLPTGCYAIKSITVETTPAPITGTLNVCIGLTTTLSTTTSGGTWSSSAPTVASVGSSTGVVTGLLTGTPAISYILPTGCYATASVTVHPNPSAITGVATVCVGTTSALSDATTGGTWSSGNTGVATIGSTGIVTGVATGTAVISYTLATGCYATRTVTVIASPDPITGTLSVCETATTALSCATPGGTWSTGSTSIATIVSTTGVATGVAAGTTTVTYALSSGCRTIETLTVNPRPAVITGTFDVCVGTTTTLSDATSGGTWSSSNPSFATVGSTTGVVTGVAPGTVTISYTIPTGCYRTVTITVNDVPAAISGPDHVCVGSTITLTDATPGGTWSTLFTSGIATVGSTTGVVTGISVGVALVDYIVTSTGCMATMLVTVNPLPAAIGGTPYVCESGGTTTLTDATSGGTWSSSSTGIGTIGSLSGLVTGISAFSTTGTYTTVTYTTAAGCTATITVTVFSMTADCSPCYQFGGAAFSMLAGNRGTSLSSGNYYMTNDVTVTDDINIPHAVVFVAPGKRIYVNDTSALTISGSHLLGCSGMWEGITLQTGTGSGATTGRLILQADGDDHHTLLEDAVTAVTIQNPVTPSPGGSYFISSEKTIFNRNQLGIRIGHYTPNTSSYPFLIHNTVFTSRNFATHYPNYPFRWPKTWSGSSGDTTLKEFYSTGDVYKPPFAVDDPNALGSGNNYPTAICKNGSLPYIGIRLDSIGTKTIDTSQHYIVPIPANYAEIVIGDTTYGPGNPNQNLFDNLHYGIYAVNTNLTCVNNAFINIYALIPRFNSAYDGGGNGVYAKVTNDLYNQNRLRVYSPLGSRYNNIFYGFVRAVECANYFNMIGKNTYMIHKGSGVPANDLTGKMGYYINTAKFDTIDISYDTIINVAAGITLYGNVAPWYISLTSSSPHQFFGYGNITRNLIQARPPGASLTTGQRIDLGISVQNPLFLTTGGYTYTNQIHVDFNRFEDVYNGIYMNNFWRQPITNFDNYIIERRNGSGVPRRLQYGINNTHCWKGKVYYNRIFGTDTTVHSSDSIRACYMVSNSGLDIGCNESYTTGRGFEFFLNNPMTQWHDNQMTGHMKGYVLNRAIIGAQGGTTIRPVINDEWAGTWSSVDTQTYVINSNSALSPIYVNNTTVKFPTINGGRPFFHRYDTATGGIHLDPGYMDPCTQIWSPPTDDTTDLYVLIAQQHIPYIEHVISNNWTGQYSLWKSILVDSTLIDSSATIAQFAHMADSMSRYKYLTDIEMDISNGDFDSALTKLGYDIDDYANTAYDVTTEVSMADDISADNIVLNYTTFYNLYIKYVTNDFDLSDSLALYDLASLCPARNGAVVFQARALYTNYMNDPTIMFDDDSCMDADTGYYASKHSYDSKQRNIHQQKYVLYPNPNDGSFIVQQHIQDTSMVKVSISDAVGRNIYKNELIFWNSKADLNVGAYPPGLYLLEITDSKKQIFRCKFVINK